MKRFFMHTSIKSRNLKGGAPQTPDQLSEGQKVFDEVVKLYAAGQHHDALNLIEKIEKNYPELSMATKTYKGKASIAILDGDNQAKKSNNRN